MYIFKFQKLSYVNLFIFPHKLSHRQLQCTSEFSYTEIIVTGKDPLRHFCRRTVQAEKTHIFIQKQPHGYTAWLNRATDRKQCRR